MKSRARIEKMEDGKGVYGYAITGVEKRYRERVVLRPDRVVPKRPSKGLPSGPSQRPKNFSWKAAKCTTA